MPDQIDETEIRRFGICDTVRLHNRGGGCLGLPTATYTLEQVTDRGSVGFYVQGEHKVREGTLVIQRGLAYVPEYTNVYIHTHTITHTVHSHEQTIKWKD